MSPMMFAQTTVELPKDGAGSREAAISVASVPAPAVKTTTPNRRRLTAAAGTATVVRGGAVDTPRRSRPPARRRGGGGGGGEPPLAVELAVAARLEDSVRVEDHGRAGRELVPGDLILLV